MLSYRSIAPRLQVVAVRRIVEGVIADIDERDEGLEPLALIVRATLVVTAQRLAPLTIYGSVAEAFLDLMDVSDRLYRDGEYDYEVNLARAAQMTRNILNDLED